MQCSQCWCAVGHAHVWCEGDEFGRRGSRTIRVARPPANLHSEIVALCPTHLPQSLPNSADTSLSFWIGFGICHQHTDPPHGHTLLRPCRERPRRRAADQRDEVAPPHGRPFSDFGPHITTSLRTNVAVRHSIE